MLRRTLATLTKNVKKTPTWQDKPLPARVVAATPQPQTTNTNDTPPQQPYAPLFSRKARRARLEDAIKAVLNGEPFNIAEPQRAAMPGAAGACMNVLRDTGPKTTQQLLKLVAERYPGVVRSTSHLKLVLKDNLFNKVIKVRAGDSTYKDHWALRRQGQARAEHPHRRRASRALRKTGGG